MLFVMDSFRCNYQKIGIEDTVILGRIFFVLTDCSLHEDYPAKSS
jgi:hypothetical protein